MATAPEHRADCLPKAFRVPDVCFFRTFVESSVGQWQDGVDEIHDRFWSESLVRFALMIAVRGLFLLVLQHSFDLVFRKTKPSPLWGCTILRTAA